MNMTIIEGNAGKEPELRTTQSGIKVAMYSVATSKKNTKDENNPVTSWHNVVAWGDQADLVMSSVHKGTRVLIIGETKTRSYEDKDGKTAYVTEVIQNLFGVVPSRQKIESGSTMIDDSDLPF